MAENNNTFYDKVIMKLNHQLNELTTKYKEQLNITAELQKELEELKKEKENPEAKKQE